MACAILELFLSSREEAELLMGLASTFSCNGHQAELEAGMPDIVEIALTGLKIVQADQALLCNQRSKIRRSRRVRRDSGRHG